MGEGREKIKHYCSLKSKFGRNLDFITTVLLLQCRIWTNCCTFYVMGKKKFFSQSSRICEKFGNKNAIKSEKMAFLVWPNLWPKKISNVAEFGRIWASCGRENFDWVGSPGRHTAASHLPYLRLCELSSDT